MDKYRNQLLNDELRILYDSLVLQFSKKFDNSNELKMFKVQLRSKLNAAYRKGVHLSGGKNTR